MSLTLPKEVAGVSASRVSRDEVVAKDKIVSWVRSWEGLAFALCGCVAGEASASENTESLFLFFGDGECAGVSANAATASCTESSDHNSNSSRFSVDDFRNDGLGPKKRLVDSVSACLVEVMAIASAQRRCLLGGLAPFGNCALVVRRAGWGAECGAGMLATLRIADGRAAEGCDADQDDPDCASSSRR